MRCPTASRRASTRPGSQAQATHLFHHVSYMIQRNHHDIPAADIGKRPADRARARPPLAGAQGTG